jgi:hypothetical protein
VIRHTPPERAFGAPRYGTGALVNTGDIAQFVWLTYKALLPPNTIRQWASRKHIGTYGRRRERYDIREVIAYAIRRGVISP